MRLRVFVVVAVATAAIGAAWASAGSAGRERTGASVQARVFTGQGFDTCTAPSLAALSAWLASPYRALGIYIGGVNRACADGNLSASWIASAAAGGWSVLPLYVGLQAPCVAQKDLRRIDPASAGAEGIAAAQDAVSRAQLFGLQPGDPVYFDMEGYATNDAACSTVVQTFLAAWDDELHRLGYTAGVYGSAASTIRDLVALTLLQPLSSPDDVWIANWNGKDSVFGDPYVPDAYWPNHQRVHQYRGGHPETYGGVTISIDTNSVDAAVAATGAPSGTASGPSPAGTASTSDGRTSVSWPNGAFAAPATVTLTPSTLAETTAGWAAGSYLVALDAARQSDGSPLTSFAKPLVLRFRPPSAGLVPAFSADGGVTWSVLLRLPSAALPPGATAGYRVSPSGNVLVSTLVPGTFGLLADVGAPDRPAAPSGVFYRRQLVLAWQPSADNSGTVASYEVDRSGARLVRVPGTWTAATLDSFRQDGPSVFRVVAVDAAGNRSIPSRAVVVVPVPRPSTAPRAIPAWAWQLLDWQRHGRSGTRPQEAPARPPAWYWRWASWQLAPYRITRSG